MSRGRGSWREGYTDRDKQTDRKDKKDGRKRKIVLRRGTKVM